MSAGLIVLIEAYLELTKRVAKVSLWPLVYIGVTGVHVPRLFICGQVLAAASDV